MTDRIQPATQDQLNALRDPAALAAIDVFVRAGWFATDVKTLDKFFAAEPGHPAKQSLEEDARNGGSFAMLQFAVLLGFIALAILISAIEGTLSPVVFVLWTALGIGAGLLVKRYPARLYGNRKRRA